MTEEDYKISKRLERRIRRANERERMRYKTAMMATEEVATQLLAAQSKKFHDTLRFKEQMAEIHARHRREVTMFDRSLWSRPTHIIMEVLEAEKLSFKSVIVDRLRYVPLIHARHRIFFELKERTSMSYSAIGKKLGYDHTSVMHGYQCHKLRLEHGPKVQTSAYIRTHARAVAAACAKRHREMQKRANALRAEAAAAG